MSFKDRKTKIPYALILGPVFGLFVSVLVAVAATILIYTETMQMDQMNVCAMASILLGAMSAAFVTVGKVKGNRLMMCALAGVIYLVALLSTAAIAFDGVKSGIGASVALTFGGVFAVFLMGMNGGKRRRYKSQKIRL